ncbi:PREDICTED: uncharacterized protein LOC105975173 [Erythranthe guttata]|uniref:uncharacterized protein LOC105975173 n=1 Tax=Erythranthe guttata TaxID=4155 RepID=UPI00064D8BBB|nr:PREDICTED: uncharacterized protein LOC105975173 [Erythranthe guttata]|eukprot:XP_012855802.1 PREDICTED: uncharacterized protein LOC105975173 [Erythranthe guttata]
MDEDAWRTMLTGWKRPVATDEKGIETEKHEKDWSKAEQIAANMNSKALNAIFNGIDINQFKIISAWRNFKQLMRELLQLDYPNFKCLPPGLKIFEWKKMRPSMPDRFAYKITAIEEASDVDSLRLEDLIGNLQTFENKLNISRMDKERKIALQTVSDTTASVSAAPMTALEVKLTKSMSLIAKNFGKFVKRNGHPTNFERKPRTSTDKPEVKKGIRCRECHGYGHIQAECANTLKKQRKSLATTWSDDNSDSDDESEASDDDTNNDFCGTCRITEDTLEDITCTEAPHLRYVTQKNENYENLNISFMSTGNDESEDEGEDSIQHIQQQLDDLLKQCHEVSNENKLLKEREEENKGVITKLNDRMDELEMEIEVFEVEQEFAQRDIDNLKDVLKYWQDYDGERAKRIRKNLFPKIHADDHQDISPPVGTMFEASVSKLNRTAFLLSNRLDEIINAHPSNLKRIGLGYTDRQSNANTSSNQRIRFVNPTSSHANNQTHPTKFIPICHFCHKVGHVRPKCFKRWKLINKQLANQTSNSAAWVSYPQSNNSYKQWMTNDSTNCWSAILSLNACATNSWYFDSGCSKHMTGERNFLSNLHNMSSGQVTFGDGNKAYVKGKRDLNVGGLPNLNNVLYVECLKSNLLSVSQLCDLYDSVLFTKRKCEVFDENKNCVLTGYRSSDNCYKIDQIDKWDQCHHTSSDLTDLWHRKLGHLNFHDLIRLVNAGCVKGVPQLKTDTPESCGDCPLGKQVRTSHKNTDHAGTSRTFELIHMDLMGPMKTESIGGKRFWAEAMSTACYTINRLHLRPGTKNTPYEVWKGMDEEDSSPGEIIVPVQTPEVNTEEVTTVIGEVDEGMKTRNKPKVDYQEMVRYVCYTSTIEPKNIKEAIIDEYWVQAMQEELICVTYECDILVFGIGMIGVSHDRSVMPPLSGVINVYDIIHLKDHTSIGRIMLPHMHL